MVPYWLTYNILIRKIPNSLVILIDFILISVLRSIPVRIIKYFSPKNFYNFIYSIYFELDLRGKDRDILVYMQDLEILEQDSREIYQKKIELCFVNYYKFGLKALDDLNIEKLVHFLCNKKNHASHKLEDFERNWHIYRLICNFAHFNLGHKDNVKFYNQIVSYLNRSEMTSKSNERYLVNYTSNMGHLGFLFLYMNHYQNFKPVFKSRKIMLLNNKVANRYFLKLLIRSSKLQIKLIDEKTKVKFENVDTLQISQDSKGIFRLNTPLFSYSNKNTPAIVASRKNISTSIERDHFFDIKNNFVLGLSVSEYRRGLKEMYSLFPINSFQWFVVLHIKTNRYGFSKHSEARESNLNNFSNFINYISEKGGTVIRMGDSSFPKFSKSLPIFDYAHSKIKSEFMDCWLWSQCRWWTGNQNGASVIPHAFNKPRLVVDQWFWEMIGKNTDIVIPKVAVRDGEVMSIKEVFHSRISRTISRATLKSNGVSLIENTPQDILEGAREMINFFEKKGEVLDKRTSVNLEMLRYLAPSTKNVMTISPAFANRWAKSLIE